MSTVNTIQNQSVWNVQGNNQVSGTTGQQKVHHHHHIQSQDSDSLQIGSQNNDDSKNKFVNPLDSLVTNGTITQDQENAIKSAFSSARQTNQTGTYSSNQTNPISSLVSNGTISQTQADSITSAFKNSVHSHGMHHPQNSSQIDQSSTSNSNSTLADILNTLETQGVGTQDQDDIDSVLQPNIAANND